MIGCIQVFYGPPKKEFGWWNLPALFRWVKTYLDGMASLELHTCQANIRTKNRRYAYISDISDVYWYDRLKFLVDIGLDVQEVVVVRREWRLDTPWLGVVEEGDNRFEVKAETSVATDKFGLKPYSATLQGGNIDSLEDFCLRLEIDKP